MVTGLVIAGILVAWAAAVGINRRRLARYEGTGNPQQGIVVFVEPVQWLFIVWGFASFCRGLRRAKGGQLVRLFRWGSTAGALMVIPDLMRRGRLDRRAARLARFLDELAWAHPGSAIHVVGYSSGGYVGLEATKRVNCPGQIRRLVLLAASASPSYAWGELEGRVAAVHSFYPRLDAINVVGPLLFGSNDRKWGPSCGAVGFQSPPAMVSERPWAPADVRLGYLGDHFTIMSPAFVAAHVAPILAMDGLGGSGERLLDA